MYARQKTANHQPPANLIQLVRVLTLLRVSSRIHSSFLANGDTLSLSLSLLVRLEYVRYSRESRAMVPTYSVIGRSGESLTYITATPPRKPHHCFVVVQYISTVHTILYPGCTVVRVVIDAPVVVISVQ